MRSTLALLLLALFTLVGCGGEAAPAGDATVETWLPLRVGEVALEAQIAITVPEQRTGLMNRTEMGADRGMLFIYTEPRQLTFWMKNTLLPLDIGFFDSDGKLLQIEHMYPRDLRRVPSKSDQVRYALEMNRDWFSQHNLAPGAHLDLGLLKRALQARGESPRDYDLP